MTTVWYTPKEAAAALKCSVYTIRRMIRRGELQARRIGQQFRIPGHALEAKPTTVVPLQ